MVRKRIEVVTGVWQLFSLNYDDKFSMNYGKCTHTFTYASIHTYTYIRSYIYTHKFIHTYTYIHIAVMRVAAMPASSSPSSS